MYHDNFFFATSLGSCQSSSINENSFSLKRELYLNITAANKYEKHFYCINF